MVVKKYYYLPNDEDLKDNDKARKYMANLGMGRMDLFDDDGNKINDRMIAFSSVGDSAKKESDQFSKMVHKRLKTTKQRKVNP